MIAYVDASVLLRLAFGQPNALAEWGQINRGISSALIRTECLRSLDRVRLRNQLDDAEISILRSTILSLASSFQLVDLDADVLNRAAQPMPTELGTLDAIHLASALLWQETFGESLTMATHDRALAIAAQAYGMKVIGISLS
jgi:predicted nucleic acid-binding protein